MESFVGLGWEQLGGLVPKWICCPGVCVGETACQIHPEVSSDQLGENQDRNGGATLKQEEACEILSLGAGSRGRGGAWHVVLHGLKPPDASSLGPKTPQFYLRV